MDVLKYMWEKNKFLCKIALILITYVAVYGICVIVGAVQDDLNTDYVETVSLPSQDGIQAYDIEGLTDEEIMEYLNIIRNRGGY